MMLQAWGKTDKYSGEFHPLAHHSMDVAAVFARMLRLPVIRDRLEAAADAPLTETTSRRLAALAFLHNIGKLYPGFQAKGWADGIWRGPTTGHLKESWAFLMLAARWTEHPFHGTIRRILDWGEAVPPLMGAMFAHHGRPVEPPSSPTLLEWPSLAQYDWRTEARGMSDALLRWFPEAFESGCEHVPGTPRLCHEVAGLAALADWIGSDRQFFEFEAPFASDYDTRAHCAAARALTAIGFDSRALVATPAPSFRKLTDFPEPNPAQAAVGSVDSDARLVILEAETGSGKTEAALWRFTQLFSAGMVSSLYFAVPTRAAARQLHDRVDKALRRVSSRISSCIQCDACAIARSKTANSRPRRSSPSQYDAATAANAHTAAMASLPNPVVAKSMTTVISKATESTSGPFGPSASAHTSAAATRPAVSTTAETSHRQPRATRRMRRPHADTGPPCKGRSSWTPR